MEKNTDRPAPLRTTPHPPATLSTSLGSTSPLQWGSTSLVWCVVRGEGGPFYSPRRSVPAKIKNETSGHRLLEDKIESPAKTHLDGSPSGFGQPKGWAGPRWRSPRPIFLWLADRWAQVLSLGCILLGTPVSSSLWALFVSETQDWIICAFYYAFTCIFLCISAVGACKAYFTKTRGID